MRIWFDLLPLLRRNGSPPVISNTCLHRYAQYEYKPQLHHMYL